MVKLNYNSQDIHVPENWDDIALGDWDVLHRLNPKTSRERVAYVAQLCKVDADALLSWPAEVFNIIVAHTRFVFGPNPYTPSNKIDIEGTQYHIATEDGLTLGEWVDADEAQKAGENVLSNVLAIVCRPVGEAYDYRNNEKRRELFAAQPLSKVLPLLGFFLQCKQQSDKLTRTFSQLAALADLLPPSTATLRSLGAGTKLLRIWPIIRFLILNALLRWRLSRLLTLYGITATKQQPSRRKGNKI